MPDRAARKEGVVAAAGGAGGQWWPCGGVRVGRQAGDCRPAGAEHGGRQAAARSAPSRAALPSTASLGSTLAARCRLLPQLRGHVD